MRKIDSKYHIVEEEIIGTSSGAPIPEDEPLFLFRARDSLAAHALAFYALLCQRDGCAAGQIESAQDAASRFLAFKRQHPGRMKQPGRTMVRRG